MTRRGDTLGVWMDDIHVADLVAADSVGHVRCQYSDEALEKWRRNSPVLSCSLPLAEEKLEATPFFRGLLPEGEALRILAERAGVATSDTFALLDSFGRDVAGALVVSREVPSAKRYETDPLSPSELEEVVEGLADNPLGADDASELSLAGLQDKLLLVKDGDGWARPLRGKPSTHILKVDDLRFPGLVSAEYLCLLLARHVGLTTIDPELTRVGERDCLIVSRFDRQDDRGEVKRIHQEDLCQATGVDPAARAGRAKYESHGGPGLKQMAGLLDEHSLNSHEQLDRLSAVVTFTVLIGNADAHGKNLALLHGSPEHVTLAPLYDTVPTALWPSLRTNSAMTIGAQLQLKDIGLSDIAREATRWAHSKSRARDTAVETVEKMLTGIESEIIPTDSDVAKYISKRAAHLLKS